MREVFDYILGSASWNCPSAIYAHIITNSFFASPNLCSILFQTDQLSPRRNFQDLKTASEMCVSISLVVFWKPSCKRTHVGTFDFDGSHRYRFYIRCSDELCLIFLNETNHTSKGLSRDWQEVNLLNSLALRQREVWQSLSESTIVHWTARFYDIQNQRLLLISQADSQ